jgi:uncharacterized protein (TIGR00290 family)
VQAGTKGVVLWSGGKDSALALHEARQQLEVVALLTTVTEAYDRISMHGVRTALLERQAHALGLPVEKVLIPAPCCNADYESLMLVALERFRTQGVSVAVAGDIFLQDVRAYREKLLARAGLAGIFPLWGRDSHGLARHFLTLGFRAVLCCIDSQALAADFVGRPYDEALLADLPAGADPCGERGEFHTFVWDGPGFAQPVAYQTGARVLREDRFWYCDLLLDEAVCLAPCSSGPR